MNRLFLIFVIIMIGCNSKSDEKFEMISYYWEPIEAHNNDTVKCFIKPCFYTQFDKNGNCYLLKKDYKTAKTIIEKIKMDKNILASLFNELKSINSDTFLTPKCNERKYDGPSIGFVYYKEKKSKYIIEFIDVNNTNKQFLKCYQFFDSVAQINKYSNLQYDTVIFQNKMNILIKTFYHRWEKRLPIVLKGY